MTLAGVGEAAAHLAALSVAVLLTVGCVSSLLFGVDPPAKALTRIEWTMLAVITAGAIGVVGLVMAMRG